MRTRAVALAALTATVLAGCSGGSTSKDATSGSSTATSSPTTSSQTSVASSSTANPLPAGLTSTPAVDSLKPVVDRVFPADRTRPADSWCTKAFGSDAEVSKLIGHTVHSVASAGAELTNRPPIENSGDLSSSDYDKATSWGISCGWTDHGDGAGRARPGNPGSYGSIEHQYDEIIKAYGIGVICKVTPTQWTAKPPAGNSFTVASWKVMGKPDPWTGPSEKDGVTVACRVTPYAAAQYAGTTKAMAAGVESHHVELQQRALKVLP